MFDQATLRTSIKFGVISALASFSIILVLFFIGKNPYGELSTWSLIFTPVFVFWGLAYFKKYTDQELGFLRALKVGWGIAFYTALCSGMLIFIFAYFAGPELIKRHILEMKALIDATRQAALESKVLTQETLDRVYAELDKTTPYTLALDSFYKKLMAGFLAGLVAAVFFRK